MAIDFLASNHAHYAPKAVRSITSASQRYVMLNPRGVATNFRLGGRILTGGTGSGESKPPTPEIPISPPISPSDFILEILEIPKV